jgi:tetratricopeptide (TPR) repeat protein
MRASQQVNRIACAILVASLACLVVTLNALDHLRQGASLQETLYIRSPKMLKRMSLGYNGLLADIYWTRAVQYFGSRHHRRAEDYPLLAPLLNIATELDPQLIAAYRFGANFLAPKPPDGAGTPDQAIALLERGIRNNPDNWRLYYELGFVYYIEMKDYAKAAAAFAQGSKVPNAHPFLRTLAAMAAQHAGENQTARMLWQMTYNSTKDPLVRENALDHLRALQVDEEVIQLERILAVYRARTGRIPTDFRELVAAGYLSQIPVDPDGLPYKLVEDARVELQNPDNFPFVNNGLPFGYTAPTHGERTHHQSGKQPIGKEFQPVTTVRVSS